MIAKKTRAGMARKIADAACAYELETGGHQPSSVTVVLSDQTLVITLQGALSAIEEELAHDPTGAAQVQDFHQKMFEKPSNPLWQAIRKITGVAVHGEDELDSPATGVMVKVMSTGTIVHLFLLSESVPLDVWSGTVRSHGSREKSPAPLRSAR